MKHISEEVYFYSDRPFAKQPHLSGRFVLFKHPVSTSGLLPFRRMVYKHRVCKYHLCAHRFIRRYRKSRLRRLTCYAGSRKRRNIPY